MVKHRLNLILLSRAFMKGDHNHIKHFILKGRFWLLLCILHSSKENRPKYITYPFTF